MSLTDPNAPQEEKLAEFKSGDNETISFTAYSTRDGAIMFEIVSRINEWDDQTILLTHEEVKAHLIPAMERFLEVARRWSNQ